MIRWRNSKRIPLHGKGRGKMRTKSLRFPVWRNKNKRNTRKRATREISKSPSPHPQKRETIQSTRFNSKTDSNSNTFFRAKAPSSRFPGSSNSAASCQRAPRRYPPPTSGLGFGTAFGPSHNPGQVDGQKPGRNKQTKKAAGAQRSCGVFFWDCVFLFSFGGGYGEPKVAELKVLFLGCRPFQEGNKTQNLNLKLGVELAIRWMP